MRRRAARSVLCMLITPLLLSAFTPGIAVAHGGDRPAGFDPATGKPILHQRELNLRRAELHAERRATGRGDPGLRIAASPTPASGALVTPAPGSSSSVTWTGSVTYLPESFLGSPFDGDQPCDTAECQEFTLTVPSGAKSLYLNVTWQRPDQAIYLYAISPSGQQMYGMNDSDIDDQIDKRPGNSTTLNWSETSIADPAPGIWSIRARAAWGLDVTYTATAAVTATPVLSWDREDPRELARWATHRIPVNVVFVGIEPDKEQIAALSQELPTKFRPSVATWQTADGGRDSDTHERDNCRLTNWTRCHFGGTYSEEDRAAGGHVPFFEPVLFEYDYHFIQADEAYARAAFQKMEDFTKKGFRPPGLYLNSYTASDGAAFRSPPIPPQTPVDVIDAIKLEEWLFTSRFQFCTNFTDLESGKVHGGGFISPDLEARYDPNYDQFGRNVDLMPQGRNEGVTFFYLDTHSPEYAKEYFDVNRYHSFGTMDAFTDPDNGRQTVINNTRLWGGRYRFAFLDLGSAPTPRESSTPVAATVGGSADYPLGDPPIWQYRNDPRWQPRFISQGLARNVYTLLFSRMTANYLYRPIPRDVYQLQAANILDYYATSESGYGTVDLDLRDTYNEDLAARWLSAAIPHVTLRKGSEVPGFDPYFYLGCSDFHIASKSDITETFVQTPDPTCVGDVPDPLQQALEVAKSKGEDFFGSGVPYSQAASPASLRNYWEAHRDPLAPVSEGVHSFILINVVFEKLYAWVAPLVVGGISYPTSHRENWGNFQSINEALVGNGFTYTVEHEASHALGLLHPFNIMGVDRDSKGGWEFYYDTYSWLPNVTQSPTTYAGVIYPYGVWDQDNLMRGRSAEFIKMAQDAISHAYWEYAASGGTAPERSTSLRTRRAKMESYLETGKALFAKGDYLHAEFAYQNAYLAASGRNGTEVKPRLRTAGDKALFQINPQGGMSRDTAITVCGVTIERAAPDLAATGDGAWTIAAGLLLAVAGMLLFRSLHRTEAVAPAGI